MTSGWFFSVSQIRDRDFSFLTRSESLKFEKFRRFWGFLSGSPGFGLFQFQDSNIRNFYFSKLFFCKCRRFIPGIRPFCNFRILISGIGGFFQTQNFNIRFSCFLTSGFLFPVFRIHWNHGIFCNFGILSNFGFF